MLSNAEQNVLHMLISERENLGLRSLKDDIEYLIVDRWLKTRIRELQNRQKGEL